MSTRVEIHRTESEEVASAPSKREFVINGYELFQLAIRNRRLIVIAAFAVMVAVGAILFLFPNQYVSTATILPSTDGNSLSELRSLAGLAGLMPTDNNPSALFPTVLTSRMMYDAILGKTYSFDDDGQAKVLTLKDYFDQENPDRLRMALADITNVSTDKKTAVISIGVETSYPGLSQAILTSYLSELEDYNLNKRQSQAKENERYLERQMTERTEQLARAEDSLQKFQRFNRDWANSSDPEVAKIIGRLQREVEVNNEAYLFLRQQYEISRLEAQKDVPIVRVLDEPSLPILKSRPHRLGMIAASGVVTGMLMIMLIFVVNRARRREDSELDYLSLRGEIETAFPKTNRLVTRCTRRIRPLEPTI